MIAPTSDERIHAIAKEAKGFLYCVSSLGVTGVRSEIKTDIGAMVSLVQEVTDIPVAVGFGISTPEQAKKRCLNFMVSPLAFVWQPLLPFLSTPFWRWYAGW